LSAGIGWAIGILVALGIVGKGPRLPFLIKSVNFVCF
jgi:hypothetical protein